MPLLINWSKKKLQLTYHKLWDADKAMFKLTDSFNAYISERKEKSSGINVQITKLEKKEIKLKRRKKLNKEEKTRTIDKLKESKRWGFFLKGLKTLIYH